MLGNARELAGYQAEPKQLPSGSFGKNAYLRLGFEPRLGRSVLATLHRRAPLLAQQALYWDEQMPGLPCVSIISNAGGILQGDRNLIEIDVAPDAQAHVTTQAATRIHEMDCNFATQTQNLTLGSDSYLEYIPHPVIPHKHSRFVQHTTVSIDPAATLIYSETLMPGRKYYGAGELFQYDLFSSSIHAARPDGKTLFTEKFIIEPHRFGVSRLGAMGSFQVFGNVILLTPKKYSDRLFGAIDPAFDKETGLASGVSRLPYDAGLVFKVLGFETAPVSAAIRAFWSLARQEVTGARIPDNFLWA
ncbi:urease accessory protein UreD [Rhodopila sp.]|uniref:urease accessory protein UreD n=1 Tax=Rhodopila sp. TaxID=2480087 RepID=UPI002CC3D864|nr:urease accessory protein UreD [Rhodopila sp.]HVZ09962.1 urease accessory protein UreD [Rhodopila sp.]